VGLRPATASGRHKSMMKQEMAEGWKVLSGQAASVAKTDTKKERWWALFL